MVGGIRMGPAPIRWIREPGINRLPPEPAEFQNPAWYHRKGRVVPDLSGNWPVDQTVLGDFPGGLKDLATERQDVRDALVAAFGRWIERVDFDGFRIDTIKHVEESFWADFCPRIRQIAAAKGKQNFLMFGEAFDGDDAVVSRYTQHDMLDSVFFFPQKYSVMDGVIKHNGPTVGIEQQWARKSMYGQSPQPGGIGLAPAEALVTFVDNHDVPRFQFGESDDKRLRLALGFLMMSDGIPCIYYGTEQGLSGGGDPSNRERLWDTGYNTAHPLFVHTRRLIDIRKGHVAIRRGDTTVLWSTTRNGLEEDAGIFAFERRLGAEAVVYVMNVNPNKASHTAFGGAGMTTSFPQGTVLEDLLDPSYTATVGQGGKVTITAGPLSQRILIAR
jgi:glycosidase